MFENIYLIAFLILYYIIVFIIPSARVKRVTGVNSYVFKKTSSAQDFLGKMSAPLMSVVFIVALISLFFPSWIEYLGPFRWLENTGFSITGFILIHLALIWIIFAQIQMSDSWRVGIDYEIKTELKTQGLFSVSRNPVFLGILITLIGIFLILPVAFTLLTVVSTFLMFQVQVRLEEEHLLKTHGSNYQQYCRNVPRWLFFSSLN